MEENACKYVRHTKNAKSARKGRTFPYLNMDDIFKIEKTAYALLPFSIYFIYFFSPISSFMTPQNKLIREHLVLDSSAFFAHSFDLILVWQLDWCTRWWWEILSNKMIICFGICTCARQIYTPSFSDRFIRHQNRVPLRVVWNGFGLSIRV